MRNEDVGVRTGSWRASGSHPVHKEQAERFHLVQWLHSRGPSSIGAIDSAVDAGSGAEEEAFSRFLGAGSWADFARHSTSC